MAGKIIVSVIIVHYKVKKELLDCLFSIENSKPKTLYEVIVVDNDEVPTIEKDLFKKFPNIKYIKLEKNIGFGAANNVGAKMAKGKYIFFLNPDTKVFAGCIDCLVSFLQKDKTVGVAAPVLLDKEKKLFPLQGANLLTPVRAIFALSFVYKLFPNNSIANNYFLLNWDKKYIKEVDVVPGTAFIIRKNIFEKIGGFDEKFFLFFEEHDVCFRVKKLRYKIFMIPQAKVMHLWGQSTKNLSTTKEIFNSSRKYYFQKHFGFFAAYVVEIFCR